MLYGTPAVQVYDDQTDRIGLRTLVLSQLWQPQAPVNGIADLDAQKPGIPEVPGGVILVGEQTRRKGGAMVTFWTFEGINGDGKNVTFKNRGNSIDYWFEASFSERSILKRPNIQDLLNQFGGYVIDNQVIFPPLVPDTSGASANGAVKTTAKAGDPNPLFGRETYFGVGGTYHYRYAVPTGAGLPNIAGKIFTTGALPGRPPSYDGSSRNWLGLPISPHRCGPVDEVVEMYWLSEDEGGWETVIYGKSAKAPAGGLTTGSLTTGSL